MLLFTVVAIVLLAIVALVAGTPKVLFTGRFTARLQAGGLHETSIRLIGVAEVAAAGGLVAGLAWPPVGVFAAGGLTVLFLCAIGFHIKSGDYSNKETRIGAVIPAILAIAAIAAAVTLSL